MSIQDLSEALAATGTRHRIVTSAESALVGEKLQASYVKHIQALLKANSFVYTKGAGALADDGDKAVSVSKVPGSGTPGKYYVRVVLADNSKQFATVALEVKRDAKGKLTFWLNGWPQARRLGDDKALEDYFKKLADYYKPVVTASASESGVEADALTIHFKSSSERNKERKQAKIYRQKNKSKLKLKAKKYALKMKHKKPNALRSRIAKLVAKHYKH